MTTPWRMRTHPDGPHGVTVITAGAQAVVDRAGTDLAAITAQHSMGEQGQTDAEDRALNLEGWESGGWFMSVWPSGDAAQPVLWVITDHGHAVTTVLLPDEY